MGKVVIKDNHITLDGTKHFTANALEVSIGSHGRKATPLFGQNKLEVKGHLPAPGIHGKVRVSKPIELDTANSTKADFTSMFSAGFKPIGFTGSSAVVYDNLATGHLKLVQLWVEENDVKNWINGAAKQRTDLANDGSDARVVHLGLVAMEGSFATSFTSGTNFDVTADAAGIISINATGSLVVSGKSIVTLAEGTVYGYLLLKPIWNADKTRVVDTRVDEWSIN